MKTRYTSMVIYLLSICWVTAYSPAGDRPQVFTGGDRKKVIFFMIPGVYEYSAKRKYSVEPIGVAYKLLSDGSLKELYRTKGWYSDLVHVSDTAQYLVRVDSVGGGIMPREDHIAVAFYKDGKLIKSYSTAQMIKDHEKLSRITNRYFWRGEVSKLEADNKYTLDTIDGWRYSFDITTGKILSQTKK